MSREPSDAPGLEWKKRAKDGARIPRWRARKKAVALGYRPSVFQLKIDPNDHAAIAEQCREEWAKMEAWLANERPAPVFNGTLAGLIDLYLGDEYSPYHDLRHRTQRTYDQHLKTLKASVGARRIDRLNGEDFRRWYRKLREPKSPGLPARVARAHDCMTMLRILFGYGQTMGLPNSEKLKGILTEMRFKNTPPRKAVITYEQVTAFIAKAHELGQSELALAQALQFEGTLRQIDVIGEWLPDPERRSGARWANGLLWQHIRDFVLVKDTTKTGQEAGIDFKLYPLAFAELQRVAPDERVGPVIKDSRTGQPFKERRFQKNWRTVARAAGIPDNVMNRDSRAGGVTEGSDAGADLEHLRHHASHSSATTTARYSRKTLTKTRAVARLRVAHREEKNDQNGS